jgi:hypothetical protein
MVTEYLSGIPAYNVSSHYGFIHEGGIRFLRPSFNVAADSLRAEVDGLILDTLGQDAYFSWISRRLKSAVARGIWKAPIAVQRKEIEQARASKGFTAFAQAAKKLGYDVQLSAEAAGPLRSPYAELVFNPLK